MNRLKTYLTLGLGLCLGLQESSAQKIKVKWDFSANYHPSENRVLQLTLINTDNVPIQLDTYDLWFNSMYPIEEIDQKNPAEINRKNYRFHNRNGNLYSVDFVKGTRINVKDSLILQYKSPYPITHTSLTPNGFYLESKSKPSRHIEIGHPEVIAAKVTPQEENNMLSALYARNSLTHSGKPQAILPTPAHLKMGYGAFSPGRILDVSIDEGFNNSDRQSFSEYFRTFPNLAHIQVPKDGQGKLKISQNKELGKEAYHLKVSSTGIEISASHAAGVFYAVQSLRSLLTPEQLQAKAPLSFPILEVQDEPRFAYRGFMMDISRNFKDIHTIKKYIDVMATLKLNKFHLHFIDDEGWRLEIPSLPELTEIGSKRSGTFKDGNSIQPAYGSGSNPTENAFLTKEQFKELLTYASERHVTIIPEIETPGHARAAIKAMETRYHRLMKAGKQKEAEEFLLYEAADSSKYSSAQYWDDNVMNPALPSVYRFIDVVLEDIKKMYQEVGLELKLVSLGGDEVPSGSWEGSPIIKQLMTKERMKSVYEVWPYYVEKINAICASKGMNMAGWEEFGMVNQGKGMQVNPELNHLDMYLDVWNNVIGGGQEDLAYRLANAGYKTVFTSCANYYLDMVWDRNFNEPGLKWASITDLYHTYSMLPEAFFANMKYTQAGKDLEDEYIAGKVRLTEKGRSNLVGIKAALWAETVLTAERMDYMLFPRLFAMAERAWAPKRKWENDQEFNKSEFDKTYNAFVHKVGSNELQKLDFAFGGFKYRLPSVGINAEKGTLHANTEYPGFQIYYTEDGSIPTVNSRPYPKGGIALKDHMTVKLAAIDQHGRSGRVSTYTRN